MLFKQGAYISIAARNVEKLEKAVEIISKEGSGKVQYFKFDFNNPKTEDVEKMLDDSENKFGNIEYLFCNAGFSLPSMFLEAEPEHYERQINTNFMGYIKISQPVAKRMAKRRSGTIVYTASILACMTCAGYSPYSPTKHAIKALADAAKIELKPYGVNVHLYLPGTILTPGYEEENKMKPEVTKKIEGTADCVTADQCAIILLNGMRRGDYTITTEMMFELTNIASLGSCDRENLLFQLSMAPVSVLLNYIINYINHKEMSKIKLKIE
mmetsp:Transcript_9918/g.11230  ORF Transcript_9918/g.11230 Transcript_9918/m.11230 type:complete len:269 (-) Transcript_9918:10-816(-)